jgi:hypothetical protein
MISTELPATSLQPLDLHQSTVHHLTNRLLLELQPHMDKSTHDSSHAPPLAMVLELEQCQQRPFP